MVAGHIVLFTQGIACSAMYVSEKPLLKRYPALVMLGYAYLVATVAALPQAACLGSLTPRTGVDDGHCASHQQCGGEPQRRQACHCWWPAEWTCVLSLQSILHALCPACKSGWSVPGGAWLGIAYWVFIGSILGATTPVPCA